MPIIPDYKPTTGDFKPQAPSLGAAMAPGKALAGLGESITGAAETIDEAAMQHRHEQEIGATNDARLQLQQTLANHDEFRAQNPEKSNAWEADISSRIDSARDEFMKRPGLSPEFKKKMADQYNVWKTDYSTKARTDALTHERAQARTSTSELTRAYRRAGKYDDARQIVNEAAEAKLFSPGEVEADLTDIDFDEQEQRKRDVATRYELEIDDNPTAALEVLSAKGESGFLNEPEMEDGTRFRLIKMAERGLAVKRGEEFDIFKAAIDRGEVTAEELKKDPLYLGDSEKKSLAAYMKRQTPPTYDEDRQAWKQIDNIKDAFNAAKSGTLDEVAFRNAHRDARMKIMELIPQGYNGPLMESLQHYSPARIYDMKSPAPPTREDVKKDLAVEVRSTLSAAYDAGFFGTITEDTPPMEKEKAARKRRDLEIKALDWIATQKEITPEGARAYTDSLLSTDRVKSTAADLRQFIPGAAQRLRPAPAPPMLPPKQGTKDKATPDPLQIPPGDGNASADLLPARQLETFLDSNQ